MYILFLFHIYGFRRIMGRLPSAQERGKNNLGPAETLGAELHHLQVGFGLDGLGWAGVESLAVRFGWDGDGGLNRASVGGDAAGWGGFGVDEVLAAGEKHAHDFPPSKIETMPSPTQRPNQT